MARAIDKQTMLNLIIEAKMMDPETGSFSEWLAEYLVEHLPTLTPQNEWVSVEDRLPASGQNVIATNGSDVGEAWYASLSRSWYRYNGLEWNRICREVTHWMPLPAPPEKENSHE